MKGITNERPQSLGSVVLTLVFEHLSIPHKFHVVDDDFPIPTHGILGKDFIRLHECILNYSDMTFTMQPKGCTPTKIPIRNEILNGLSAVPPRSETFKLFRITSDKFPCVVQRQEIAENIFVPTTIVHKPESWIRVLNISNDMKYVQSSRIKSTSVNEYDIFLVTNPEKTVPSQDRANELAKILKGKIPTHIENRLLPLCTEFNDIFHLPNDKPSINNFYTQTLHVTDNTPVSTKNYRTPQTQKQEIKSTVKQLLENDLIEMSTSSYNSPLILVPKKSSDGTKRWRMCVDYRLLNRKLIPDKFPLPRIDEILDGLGRARYFSVIDLESGYHQIPIEKNSRHLTAFSTENGFYQWKVLPFGISVAPASFTRMMTLAFSGLSPEQAFIYMDDAIIIGYTEENHLKNLKTVFETCRKFNLKINPNKCAFFRPEVNFLGHRCTDKGILPDITKLNVVEKYPVPKNANEAKRFVAFSNYYRRFIPRFSEIAKPINALTKKRQKFEWTQACQQSFDKLKHALINPPILIYPDFNKRFIVTVDASMSACAAYLSQERDGIDCPIAYISRTFKKGEINKAIIEKELIAIHFAVTVFRPYLYGREFTVYSDHKPLIFLYKLKNPSSKLNRLRLDLEEYKFEIIHIKGTENVIADALSRIHIDDLRDQYAHEILAITRAMTRKNDSANETAQTQTKSDEIDKQIKSGAFEELYAGFKPRVPRAKLIKMNVQNNKLSFIQIDVHQHHKKLFELKICAKNGGNISIKIIILGLERLANAHEINLIQWPLHDEIFRHCRVDDFKQSCNLYLKNLTIALIKRPTQIHSKDEQKKLLEKYHNDEIFGGHCGQKRLYANLRAEFYWPNMTKDVSEFVSKCHTCKLAKPQQKTKEPMCVSDTPQKAFDLMQIDTVGPLIQSNQGNKYAVTLVCELTKYLIAIPVPNNKTETIARAIFTNFILIYGPMRAIKTDRGSEYNSKTIEEICKLLKIQHHKSTAYHHETVGGIERSHRLLNEYLRAYLNGNLADWDTYLSYFVFCYNTSRNTNTNLKYSPYELVFGKKHTMPDDILSGHIDPIYNIDEYALELKHRLQSAHNETREIINKIKNRNKQYHDEKLNPIQVKIGDNVKIAKEPYDKHSLIYNGPFPVLEVGTHNIRKKIHHS